MPILQRILAALLALVLFAAALVFASIALGVLLAASLAAWAWLAWRGRRYRRGSGVVVEGEVRKTVVVERIDGDEPRDRP